METPGKQPLSREETLEARITGVFDGLTKKQQGLASFMLDNHLVLAFASAEDVGRRAGVDAATVVRFSRMLGYQGFADLRDAVRKSVPQFRTAEEKLSTTVAEYRAEDFLSLVPAQDVNNIEETLRRNSPATIEEAITCIRRASCLYVVGLGLSAYAADYLAHQFGLLGISSQRVPCDPVQAAIALADVTSDDVVIAISVWRYLRATALIMESACRTGAKAIAITDSKASAVARHADVVLLAETETPELGHSIVALITLTNVLATGIALSDRRRSLKQLKHIEESFAGWGVL